MQKKAAAWEENKLRGHAIRARTDWATTEEPATAYHLNREKKRGTDNSINKLLINNLRLTQTLSDKLLNNTSDNSTALDAQQQHRAKTLSWKQ